MRPLAGASIWDDGYGTNKNQKKVNRPEKLGVNVLGPNPGQPEPGSNFMQCSRGKMEIYG
jgi:hypothetical protein